MEIFGLELAHVVVPTLSGLAGALLTYLATRRQTEVSEKTVYIEAVEKLTAGLWDEIERVNAERDLLLEKIAVLEGRVDAYEASERQLKQRLAGLAKHERPLLARIEGRAREHENLISSKFNVQSSKLEGKSLGR